MRQNLFDRLRQGLLEEMQDFKSSRDIADDFVQRFMKLVDLCIFSLMNEEENFFALFMIQMKRAIKLDMPSATGISAGISSFTVYFNPAILLECTLIEMKALIKHEVYHIIHGHLKRAERLRSKYSAIAVNTAMDITINQYIKGLPIFMDTLEGIKMSFNVDLRPDSTLEEYAEAIQKAIDRMKKADEDGKNQDKGDIEREYDSVRTHDLWGMSKDSFNLEHLDELVKKVADNASRGKMPEGMGILLKELNEKPEIPWNWYLKKIIGTIPSGRKRTITRKDRRQPDRLELRGKLSDHRADIAVAIDISGSMDDEQIKQAMVEVLSIAGNMSSEITIIECDSEVRRVYRARGRNDIRQKLDTKGGTRFSPVFKYMKRHSMRDYFLIYFTDGIGEEELETVPANYRTLWVLTGRGEGLSLRKPYGEIKRLSNIKIDNGERDYAARNEMRDMLVEWAK